MHACTLLPGPLLNASVARFSSVLRRNLVKVVDAVGGIRTIYLKAFEHYLVSLQGGALLCPPAHVQGVTSPWPETHGRAMQFAPKLTAIALSRYSKQQCGGGMEQDLGA